MAGDDVMHSCVSGIHTEHLELVCPLIERRSARVYARRGVEKWPKKPREAAAGLVNWQKNKTTHRRSGIRRREAKKQTAPTAGNGNLARSRSELASGVRLRGFAGA